MTLNSVFLEFLRGSRSPQEYKKKHDFILSIIDSSFTVSSDVEDFALEMALIQQGPGAGTAITDFYLGATLLKFKSSKNVLVMTKNHKDFPTTIYERACLLNIENVKDVQTFGFYRINKEEYEATLDRLEKGLPLKG